MLSHEPKNYALLEYGGKLILRGVAFRSSRVEPFGEVFLRCAIGCLLADDMPGVHTAYLEMAWALRKREVPTDQVSARVRLTKTPQQYLATRGSRREASYEAILSSGRETWSQGEHIRIYRAAGGRSALLPETEDGLPAADPRDYDGEYYVRQLRETFAARMARAFNADDFATLFDDPSQPSLFAAPIESVHPLLTTMMEAPSILI